MGLMLLQLACVVLVILRHGTDAQVTVWVKPTASENEAGKGAVTTAVTGGGVTDTAALTVLEGVTGTVTTVDATVTDAASASNVAGYTTTSTDFDVHPTNGEVSVDAAHTISFATQSSYSLEIIAVETGALAGVANTGTLTITITVNAIPVFSSQTLCWYLPDNQAATTTVGTYSASAGTGETITYTIAGGNTGTDFTTPMTGGNLISANQMAKETTAAYLLELNAEDDAAVVGTGTVYVAVLLRDAGTTMETCSAGGGASGVVGSLLVVMSLMMAEIL